MKSILICLLLGLTLSYNAEFAVLYAKKYCGASNPNYHDYRKIDPNKESYNFMSQCIHAGGQDFTGCEGLDDKGMLTDTYDLQKCLLMKGWKKTDVFAPGYPIFRKTASVVMNGMIATGVEGPFIKFCSHCYDRCHSIILKRLVETYAPPQ